MQPLEMQRDFCLYHACAQSRVARPLIYAPTISGILQVYLPLRATSIRVYSQLQLGLTRPVFSVERRNYLATVDGTHLNICM